MEPLTMMDVNIQDTKDTKVLFKRVSLPRRREGHEGFLEKSFFTTKTLSNNDVSRAGYGHEGSIDGRNV
jgi:hypothetical protein